MYNTAAIADVTPNLAQVLDHPGIWRRSAAQQPRVRALPTGWDTLDARLPGGGWPQGALSEILFEQDGLGELDLLMPALAALTQEHRRVIFVAPPYRPYAPALAAAGVDLRFLHEIQAAPSEAAWSMEQCLRSGCCAAVVGWLPDVDYRSLRRLQLAAESGDACAMVYRNAAHAAHNSPAALRLKISSGRDATYVDVLKSRGLLTTTAPLLRMRA
jgi:hypothetical protein